MSILICYDGSPSARHAVAVAGATLGHKPVTLLHVWNPPDDVLAAAPFGEASGTGGLSTVELGLVVLQRAHEVADAGEALAKELGLNSQARVERNDTTVWRTILDVAAEEDSELIVIGTHGAAAVQSSVLGSVSNAVVHHSERPVLVVPGIPG